jgi:uroporphyrinogen decarboxylase
MSPPERMRALVNHQPIDRVPVFTFSSGGYAARLGGLSLGEFYTDPEKSFAVQLRAAALHGYDETPGYGWADWGGWEFGGEIRFPRSEATNAPEVIRHPVNELADIANLKVPSPETAGQYPNTMQFARIGWEMGINPTVRVGSPTTMLSSIVSRPKLLRWFIREPDSIYALLEKITTFILNVADWFITEFGAVNCTAYISTPFDSNQLLSPDIFGKFAAAYQKRINETLISKGISSFFLHLCGDQNANLPYWKDIPLPPRTIISVDSKVDLQKIAGFLGPEYIIAGNVPTETMLLGTFEEVTEACNKCLEAGTKLPGGFILMPACDMPVGTPPLNVHAMVKAARDFKY